MASLDEIFYKEFNQMMYALKGQSGMQNLGDIPLPQNNFIVEKKHKVFITGINEEYYKKLNNSEALLWGSSALRQRKFDYKGEFIKDKNGNFVLKDVPCPHECTAVIADCSIGVPYKFTSKEGFQYVDMISKTVGGKKLYKYVYIVPKKYCYKLNQTALVLSWNKLRRYYSGVALSLQSGHILYMYVIPYSPSSVSHNYRILHCKTTDDYTKELVLLRDYWLKNNIIFNPAQCQLLDYVKGRVNMAYQNLDGVLDMHERYNLNKPLGEEETFDDIEYVE